MNYLKMLIQSKDINNINPTSQQMIFCTCAEQNQKYYFERVKLWIKQLKKLNIFENSDVYVFNDGKIIESINDHDFENLNFICFEHALGRKTLNDFPGFKRSFSKAMELSLKYKFCLHIESDCLIQNISKLHQNYQKQNITAFCQCINHHFMEPIFFILNDKNIRQKLYEKYNDINALNETECFENSIKNIVSNHMDLGYSFRMEKPCSDLSNFICLGQCTNQYLNSKLIENY